MGTKGGQICPSAFFLSQVDEHLMMRQLSLPSFKWDRIESVGAEKVVHPSSGFAISPIPSFPADKSDIDFVVVNGGIVRLTSQQTDVSVGDDCQAIAGTTFFSMKRNRWYPASRFNILGSGPPALSGHSLTYLAHDGLPGCVVVVSEVGVWMLGGVDNLSAILNEKKAGKRKKKADVVTQCNSCHFLRASASVGGVRKCFIVEGNVRRRTGLLIAQLAIQADSSIP